MRKHQWGRSQKYHARDRVIYALLFGNGYAYIGQSVDVVQREKQHRRPTGGWAGQPFQLAVLERVQGTEAHAVELEHAWRLKASRAGWGIYAKPPGIPCNPWYRATAHRRWLALWRRWPWRHSRRKWRRVFLVLAICTAMAYWFIG